MKKMITLVLALCCAISLQAKGDLHLLSVDNKNETITPALIEKALVTNGFSVAINSAINGPFQK